MKPTIQFLQDRFNVNLLVKRGRDTSIDKPLAIYILRFVLNTPTHDISQSLKLSDVCINRSCREAKDAIINDQFARALAFHMISDLAMAFPDKPFGDYKLPQSQNTITIINQAKLARDKASKMRKIIQYVAK